MPEVSHGNNPASIPAAAPTVFIHDAAIDDFIATLLLAAMPSIDLKGIVVTNADCVPGPAMEVCSRLQQFLKRPDIRLGLSSARGWNPFPWEYRGDCIKFAEIPSLKPYKSDLPTTPPSGDDLLIALLEDAIRQQKPLTVLLTTAFTPLTDILADRPTLIKGVGQVAWMGGAIDVPGNLDPKTTNPAVANPHAEWNAWFDPFAVDFALRQFSDIAVFPLDITNWAAISKTFMSTLKAQGEHHAFSQLAYEGYDLTKDEPYYDMWNVCAAVWLAKPELYAKPERSALEITQWGFEQGWLRRTAQGNPQNLFLSFEDQTGFYRYVTSQLARSA